jgi:hypothetical protein
MINVTETRKLANGHFLVDGIEYLSVWAFNNNYRKNKVKINPVNCYRFANNTHSPYISIKPDTPTSHDTVFAYPLRLLFSHAERY